MSIFTMLPISVQDAVNTIAASDVKYFNGVERNAYGHWTFGDNADSLIDALNDRVLTLQNASFPPTYNQSHITHSVVNGRALMSDYVEAAGSGAYTICAVQRVPQGVGPTPELFGNMSTSTGGSPFLGPETPELEREIYNTYRGAFHSVGSGFKIKMGQWFFLANSFYYGPSNAAGLKTLRGQSGVTNTFQSGPPAGAYIKSSLPLALGNPALASATGSIDTAEFVIFDSALDLAGMQAVYVRSKQRMLRKGIVI